MFARRMLPAHDDNEPMDRIPTTHTGSLPRPADLDEMLVDTAEGKEVPGVEERARAAIFEVVRLQDEAGVDLLNDGEQGKPGYATYIRQRLSGFDARPTPTPHAVPNWRSIPTTRLASTSSAPAPPCALPPAPARSRSGTTRRSSATSRP
jgi:methionine synthase II (cobalamin-independent)